MILLKKNISGFFWLLFFINILLPNVSYGQDYNIFIYDNQEYDIPSDNVRSILRDREGYIWVGTNGGLVRFDGYQFRTFTNHLPSRYVRDIIQLNDDDLLVATDLGVTSIHLNGYKPRFKTLIPGKYVLTDSTLYNPLNLFKDKSNNIWIAEINTIVKYKNHKINRYRFEKKAVVNNRFRPFLFVNDDFGRLIVATQTGYIYVYNSGRDRFEKVRFPLKLSNPDIRINSLKAQKDGWIWMGTNKGLYRFKPNLRKILANWQVINKTINVSSITNIRNGNAYIGTWLDGVYKVKVSGNKLSSRLINEVAHYSVNDLVRDNSNGVWIGTDHGFALLKPDFFMNIKVRSRFNFVNSIHINNNGDVYKSDEFAVYKIRKRASPDKQVIYKILSAKNGTRFSSMCVWGNKLYVGTRDGSVYTYENKKLLKKIKLHKKDSRYIKYIYAQDPSHIWISQDNSYELARLNSYNKLNFYDEKKGIESNIHIIKSDSEDHVFAGGEGNSSYLYEYDAQKDIFLNKSVFLPDSIFSRKKKSIIVNDIAFGNNHDIYLATNVGLLKLVLQKNNKILFKGLIVNDYIKSVVVDAESNIWLGTENGLYYYSEGQLTRYDKNSGLPSLNMSFHALAIDKSHHLWVGTSKGIAYSRLAISNLKKTSSPIIQKAWINAKLININGVNHIEVPSNSKLRFKISTFSYPTNDIHFKLAIINQLNGKVIRTIKNATDNINISVNQLGNYNLKIQSYQSGKLWGKPLTVTLTIVRPWYARWWAGVLYGLGFIFIGFISYRFRQIKIEHDQRLRYYQRRGKMMRKILDVMPIYVYIRDTEGKYLFSNEAHAKLYNTSPENINGKKDEDYIDEESVIQNIKETDQAVLREGNILSYDEEFIDADGNHIYMHITKLPYKYEKNRHDVILGISTDISQLIKAREEVKHSEERFRILSEAAFEGIIISDDEKIIDTNNKLLELTGYKRSEIIESNMMDFFSLQERNHMNKNIWNNKNRSFETVITHKKGWEIPVEVYTRNYVHNNKRLHITVIRDITQRIKSEEQLKKYAHKLEISNKELEDFAYVVSHDLQEPLRKIQAFGKIFLNELGIHLDEYGKFYIERMMDASDRMQTLINDLLDYSRITTKARPYEFIQLNEIINGVLRDLEFRIRDTNADITIQDLPEIYADPIQMRQLFQNLIGNALKFTKQNVSPIIKVEYELIRSKEIKKDVDLCRISIQDNGIGFDPKHTKRVFKVFERLHARSEYEGTGMGLAICKKIVERHKGKISVESAEGKGTIFNIDLPFNKEDNSMDKKDHEINENIEH